MGLSQRKGAIAVGLDADFAIVDLNAEWLLDESCLRSSAGYSIYEGQRFQGRVAHTVLRGRFVMRDRVLLDDAIGRGRYLPRSFV
jgi:dihydropyrimidinase